VPTKKGNIWLDAIHAYDLYYAACSGGALLHPQQSLATILNFSSLQSSSTLQLPDHHSDEVNTLVEQLCLIDHPDPLHLPKTFDLGKVPDNYREATSCPDADVWHAAMHQEMDCLREHRVFQPTTLLKGCKAIGTRWVYAYKYHPNRSIIHRKEKAQLVTQGFSQQLEDYGDTYSPVAKMTSIHMVLAFAAVKDYKIVCYNVESAFLNALLSHEVYLKQIQGFKEANPATIYLALRAIYGLCQSSCKFYQLLCKILESLGLTCCAVDHAVFYSCFKSSPHPSISMSNNSEDLIIIIPIYIDDSLVMMNSLPLWDWIHSEMNKHFNVNDLGAASLYLGIHIDCDCKEWKMWLSQRHFVMDLLSTYISANFVFLSSATSDAVPVCEAD